MFRATLLGARNGSNTAFTLTTVGIGAIILVHSSRILKQVPGTPGQFEYTRSGVNITVGTPPGASDMFIVYDQTDVGIGLEEATISGVQNGVNTVFSISKAPVSSLALMIFKNGFMLEGVVAGPTSIQYTNSGTAVAFGLAPVANDVLRVFVAAPATAAIQNISFTGAQNSANSRFLLGYQPPVGNEPILFALYEGQYITRTIERPGGGQYALLSTNEVIFGAAPGVSTSIQFILIGHLPVTTSPFTFTLDKLSRRIGIFTQRRLDQLETREITAQVYSEIMDMYQWSFLYTDGNFATDALKTAGTVSVANGSPVVAGTGTSFGTADVGKSFRIDGSNYSYTVTNVDPLTQRLQISPVYVDATDATAEYQLYKHIYSLPLGIEYVFTMTSEYNMREIPRAVLDNIDPCRTSQSDVPLYYTYAGVSSTGARLVEIYPIPSEASVIRFTGIKQDALTDPQQKLKSVESMIFNSASAAACRVIATKEAELKRAPTWLALAETYDRKSAEIIARLDSLDLTRSDVAKVQGMRGDGRVYDGWYEATHDTWSEDLW